MVQAQLMYKKWKTPSRFTIETANILRDSVLLMTLTLNLGNGLFEEFTATYSFNRLGIHITSAEPMCGQGNWMLLGVDGLAPTDAPMEIRVSRIRSRHRVVKKLAVKTTLRLPIPFFTMEYEPENLASEIHGDDSVQERDVEWSSCELVVRGVDYGRRISAEAARSENAYVASWPQMDIGWERHDPQGDGGDDGGDDGHDDGDGGPGGEGGAGGSNQTSGGGAFDGRSQPFPGWAYSSSASPGALPWPAQFNKWATQNPHLARADFEFAWSVEEDFEEESAGEEDEEAVATESRGALVDDPMNAVVTAGPSAGESAAPPSPPAAAAAEKVQEDCQSGEIGKTHKPTDAINTPPLKMGVVVTDVQDAIDQSQKGKEKTTEEGAAGELQQERRVEGVACQSHPADAPPSYDHALSEKRASSRAAIHSRTNVFNAKGEFISLLF
jgi:hypothetical protein